MGFKHSIMTAQKGSYIQKLRKWMWNITVYSYVTFIQSKTCMSGSITNISLTFVTVIKSVPKNTPLMPSIRNNCLEQKKINKFTLG